MKTEPKYKLPESLCFSWKQTQTHSRVLTGPECLWFIVSHQMWWGWSQGSSETLVTETSHWWAHQVPTFLLNSTFSHQGPWPHSGPVSWLLYSLIPLTHSKTLFLYLLIPPKVNQGWPLPPLLLAKLCRITSYLDSYKSPLTILPRCKALPTPMCVPYTSSTHFL